MRVLDLATLDVGVLAYAGLGATSSGTQPSQWMSNVLRAHGGLQFEQALSVLADAASRELPRHLARMVDPWTREHRFRFTSHVRTSDPGAPSVGIALAGTGGDSTRIPAPAIVAFPGQLGRHLVPETIYQAVYRPELGGLHRELPKALRTGRRRRKPHRRGEERRGGLVDMTAPKCWA